MTATPAADAADRLARVPLFPLGVVLFPGGPLPLRIFEPRYLSMVSRCLRDDCEFGVLLIVAGREAGSVARTTGVGTLARIVDWSQGADGLLNITARGTRKFRLLGESRQADGLYVGDVALLPPEPAVALPADCRPLADLLAGVIDDLGALYDGIERHLDDAAWVGHRLAELLPLPPEAKQACLEATDPLERLRVLKPLLRPARRPAD